ncbi:saccharopine dehydrogenase NADP-binding domain-containing protein [Vibrio alginolyticus]|uniref:saccharopine dehydrogenase NADP-binding domain-containing protein n=1 Tax=Vibrio alginolyticus TaxID=663 RepID=UPI003F666282
MKKIAVFGATGQTGRLICSLLLEHFEFQVIACARTEKSLVHLKTSLGYKGEVLTIRPVDINDSSNLDAIFSQVDLVVGATSQWNDSVTLATKAIKTSTHYCGTYLSHPNKWVKLRELEACCLENKTMIVDDCGTHPGIPAAMIRKIQQQRPLHTAWVGGKFDLEWDQLGLAADTVSDFISEIESTIPSIFDGGHWKHGYRYMRHFNFKGSSQQESCVPMLMEEIKELVQSGGLVSTGFFVAGFGFVVDYVIMPLSLVLSKVNHRSSRALFWWGLQRFASRPRQAILQLEAKVKGSNDTVNMVVSHDDPYFITAASVVEAIKQMFTSPQPGLWTQGSFVEPEGFFKGLKQMGVSISLSTKN